MALENHPDLKKSLDGGARLGERSLNVRALAAIENVVLDWALGPSETVRVVSEVLRYRHELQASLWDAQRP